MAKTLIQKALIYTHRNLRDFNLYFCIVTLFFCYKWHQNYITCFSELLVFLRIVLEIRFRDKNSPKNSFQQAKSLLSFEAPDTVAPAKKYVLSLRFLMTNR